MNDKMIQMKQNNENLLEATFLVLEDMDNLRNQMVKDLKQLGLKGKILEAADVKTAIAHVKAEKIAFIVSDWNLPDGTGMDFLKKLRATPYYANTPFVMCTTKSEISSVLEAVQNGASDYIVKPWTSEELKKKIFLTWDTYQKNVKFKPA